MITWQLSLVNLQELIRNMKEPERLVGFINYDDNEIAFEFDSDDFSLYLYPKKELWKKYAHPSYILGKHSMDLKNHEWIPENRLSGITSDGEKIIFSVQGEPGSYHGFLSFRVIWYFCCYDEMETNRISGFSITGDAIDAFYSPRVALEQKQEHDENFVITKTVVSSTKKPTAGGGTYTLADGVTATIEIDAYSAVSWGDYRHPIYAISKFITEFSEPVTLDTTIKVLGYTLEFFIYVTYRANVGLRKIDLFVNDNGKHDYLGILVFPKVEEEKNVEARNHLIVYGDLKEKTSMIFDAIINEKISIQHICSDYNAIHSYPISRVIMILAAFERIYGNIYGKDTERSEEYLEIKGKVVEYIEQLWNETTGKRKKAAKALKDYVFNRDSSFTSNTAYALKDCAEIMEPFIKRRYNGDFESVVEGISERIGYVRNGVAHCRLDFELEAIHLSDIMIMEELLYAMQLKHIGLTTHECHEAIGRLFRERIHFKDDGNVD